MPTQGVSLKKAYDSLVNEYGIEKVKIIIAAIQIMHAGNIYGIPYSALISRFKGRPYKDSSLLYEFGMHISGLILFPVALIHGTINAILGVPDIKLDESAITE